MLYSKGLFLNSKLYLCTQLDFFINDRAEYTVDLVIDSRKHFHVGLKWILCPSLLAVCHGLCTVHIPLPFPPTQATLGLVICGPSMHILSCVQHKCMMLCLAKLEAVILYRSNCIQCVACCVLPWIYHCI